MVFWIFTMVFLNLPWYVPDTKIPVSIPVPIPVPVPGNASLIGYMKDE